MKTVKIPWHENPANLEVLRKEALFSVPGYFVKINFTKTDVALGQFCRHRDMAWIDVNPLPQRERPDGKVVPYCSTRNGQWNLVRAVLRHELRHFLLTSVYHVVPGSVLAWLINALEDGRIERWTDPSDPEAADLFKMAGNVMWRSARETLKAETETPDMANQILWACLLWRWGVERVSARFFCKLLFGADTKLISLWETVRVLVETAWRAVDTAEVQRCAECICELLGIEPESPSPCKGEDGESASGESSSGNPLGELPGDGSEQPEKPRADPHGGRSLGATLPPEDTASATSVGSDDDHKEGKRPEDGGELADSEDDEDDSPRAHSADEAMPGGSALSRPLMDDPTVEYDERSMLTPRGYAELVEQAAPLADALLRLPAVRKRRLAHAERGTYSARREWIDEERPNEYRKQTKGGKKRAISCVIDISSSNDHRAEWIRQAIMALHLAAVRDRHNLSIMACGQTSVPHYAVIQEHECCNLEAAKARIAGLEFPWDSEYVGVTLNAAITVLRKQKEPMRELLLLTDAELVVPGDTTTAKSVIRRLPGSIRLTGILLVEKANKLSLQDRKYKALMEDLLQGHNLVVCTAQEMPEALNAILKH